MNLDDLRSLFRKHRCQRILFKRLSANDNSKNQVYFGGGFSAVNLLPFRNVRPERSGSGTKTRRTGKPIFKAGIDFSWLADDGTAYIAPRAQLILYPQYPEIRFSSFLAGSRLAPKSLMNQRLPGRILFLGIADDRRTLGYVVGPQDPIAGEVPRSDRIDKIGVFEDLPLVGRRSSREYLIEELRRINIKGWIPGQRLSQGVLIPYQAQNAGGYTLESELGISPSGEAAPDFHGWEVKSYSVRRFNGPGHKAITLMTPEPTGGYYVAKGPEAFVRRYGHQAKATPDLLYFTGVHYVSKANPTTGLRLELRGYDEKDGILDQNQGLVLINEPGGIAAEWSYSSLLAHWNRKHAQAVYVQRTYRGQVGEREYKFGPIIRLGVQTDFLRLLKALQERLVYYDPAVKIRNASSKKPTVKRRNQFRVKSSNVSALYHRMIEVDVRL